MNDFDLINRIKKGDKTAFKILVCKYDKQVLNIAISYRNSEEDAKDIYQEVFLRVYKGLQNFQFRSEFSTWLFRITTNVCISFKRKEKFYQSLDEEIDFEEGEKITFAENIKSDEDIEQRVISEEIKENMQEAVNLLPEKQKMAFILKFYNGFKIKEVAKAMNCNEGTIKKYLFMATGKLRDRLQPLYQK